MVLSAPVICTHSCWLIICSVVISRGLQFNAKLCAQTFFTTHIPIYKRGLIILNFFSYPIPPKNLSLHPFSRALFLPHQIEPSRAAFLSKNYRHRLTNFPSPNLPSRPSAITHVLSYHQISSERSLLPSPI